MKQTPPPLTQEQLGQWVREQFQRANKHLAEQGVLFDSVTVEVSRYLAPWVAVWKIKSMDGKYYWVLSGDLPCDYTAFGNAATARDALRYFSLQWQLRAENLEQAGGLDESKTRYVALLRERAEMLYDLSSQENYWKDSV